MFDYKDKYDTVVAESQVILLEAKKQYKEMSNKYNETTLKVEGDKLLKRTNDKLMEVKNNFLLEAKTGLEKQREDIIKEREIQQKTKTPQDLMLEMMLRQEQLNLMESKIALYGAVGCIKDLEEIQDPTLFEIVKGKMYSQANDTDKPKIQNIHYKDNELGEVDKNIMSVKLLDMRVTEPILPIEVTNVEEYITGNRISDTFFK